MKYESNDYSVWRGKGADGYGHVIICKHRTGASPEEVQIFDTKLTRLSPEEEKAYMDGRS